MDAFVVAADAPRPPQAPRRSFASRGARCPPAWPDEVLHRPGPPPRPDPRADAADQAKWREPALPACDGRLPHRRCAHSAAPDQKRQSAPTWRAGAVVRLWWTFISVSVSNEQRLPRVGVRNGRTSEPKSQLVSVRSRTAGVGLATSSKARLRTASLPSLISCPCRFCPDERR